MKIHITIEEDGDTALAGNGDRSDASATIGSSPEQFVGSARETGAISGGAAPSAPAGGEPPAFVPGAAGASASVSTDAPGVAGDMSGGGAPSFVAARGDYDTEIEAETDEEEDA